MLIKLIENTGYHYDAVYRFYGWEHAGNIVPIIPCGAANLGEFYMACTHAWCAETCSARFREGWTADNPSLGQCTITAALVHEYFGGDVLALPLIGGGMHSFNRIGGHIVDLACEQFGRDALLDFENAVTIDARALLSDADKAARCALLRERLMQAAK